MEENRNIEIFTIAWQGITLRISYEADWLNMGERGRFGTAHLQVESVDPPRAPLPITETGYRSHFVPCEQVERHGGPVEFTRLWIDGAAKSANWRAFQKEQHRRNDEGRQLSLF